MNDEHIEARIDVRKAFADKHNTKAALGKHEPGVDKSLEQEIKELMVKVWNHSITAEHATVEMVHLIGDKGAKLLPFMQLKGPRLYEMEK